jgi:hypothetical protein
MERSYEISGFGATTNVSLGRLYFLTVASTCEKRAVTEDEGQRPAARKSIRGGLHYAAPSSF